MKKLFLPILLLAGLIFRLIISVQIYSGDINNHISWGKDILEFGPSGVYTRDFASPYNTLTPTYPPIPLLFFTISKAAFDWADKTVWDLNFSVPIFPSNLVFFFEDQDTMPAFYKVWAIASDIVIAYLVFQIAKKHFSDKSRWPYVFSILVLFNPAFFYNSAYWGQIEALPIMFLILGLYIFYQKRPVLSSLCFMLAFLSKQSSIIFIPILALMFLVSTDKINILKGVILSLVVFWISFLPFMKPADTLAFPITTYLEKIKSGSGSDYVTDHAFNFWAILTGLGKIPDGRIFEGGIPYRGWGLVFFGIALIFVFAPLLRKKITPPQIFGSLSLISISAFMFLTRMHGRYLQPALAFLLLYCIHRKKILPVFIYLSIFYFLNLYHNWWAPRIPSLVDFISKQLTIDLFIIGAMIGFSIILVDYFRLSYHEKNG